MDRLGLAGHSLRGKISKLTATEDARPNAIFGIDPVDAAGGPGSQPSEAFPSVTPELMPRITVPLGLVGETTNASCKRAARRSRADSRFIIWLRRVSEDTAK